MSKKKSRSKQRTIADYTTAAKKLAKFAPSLKKYSGRKSLTRWEKAAISRKENLLRDAWNLVPVDKPTARKLKTKLFAPGVQAVQLSNTGAHVEIKVINDDTFVATNGRLWVYWSLPNTGKRTLRKAGETIFQSPETQFPMEQIVELAERAFEEAEAKVVYLWGERGRVGDGFASLKQFVMWLEQYYQHYRDTSKWVNGVAFAIGEANKPYKPEDWEKPEERELRRKERQAFKRKMKAVKTKRRNRK